MYLLHNKVYGQKNGVVVSPFDDVIVGVYVNVMAAHASELEIAKKNLTDAIGDNVKQYVILLLSESYLLVVLIFYPICWLACEIQNNLAVS